MNVSGCKTKLETVYEDKEQPDALKISEIVKETRQVIEDLNNQLTSILNRTKSLGINGAVLSGLETP